MTKDAVRKFLGDSSNPLRVKFEALVEGGHDNDVWRDQTRDETGHFDRLPNHVREPEATGPPDPASPPQAVPAQRDRSHEPQAGNSIGYAVRRLEREAPNDPVVAAAYARLKAGDITANAAEARNLPLAPPAHPRLQLTA